MKSNYKKLGEFIEQVDIRNSEDRTDNLLGVSTQKIFIKSVANTVGTNFKRYKVVTKHQFTYVPDTSRRGDKIGIAMLEKENAIVSQAYTVFEIMDHNKLMPEYLMMWFRRPEFDRYARFKSHGSVREIFDWDEMCETELPVPPIEKQRETVTEYNAVANRIKLNEQLNQKLEETAATIYKHWFVDFEDNQTSELTVLDDYIEFNPKISIKKGGVVPFVEMASVQENCLSIQNVINKPFSSGTKFMKNDTLLARITPSLENGKSGLVDFLNNEETAFGSTEFIVMRPHKNISPYWVYCITKNEDFRTFAISGMTGTSGRQRVDAGYLKNYELRQIDKNKMKLFHRYTKPIFQKIKLNSEITVQLKTLQSLFLSRLAN